MTIGSGFCQLDAAGGGGGWYHWSPEPEGTAPRHTLVADDYETLCESRGVMGKNPSLTIDKGASSTFQSSAFALDWTPGGPEDKDAVRVLSAGGGDGRRPR